jgi:hypothetical protein
MRFFKKAKANSAYSQSLVFTAAITATLLTGCGQSGFAPNQLAATSQNSSKESTQALANVDKAHAPSVQMAIGLVGGSQQFSQLSSSQSQASGQASAGQPQLPSIPSTMPSLPSTMPSTMPSVPSMPSLPSFPTAGSSGQMPDLQSIVDQMKTALIQLIDQNASALSSLPADEKKQITDAIAQAQSAQGSFDTSQLPAGVQSLVQANQDILNELVKVLK